MNSVEEYSSRLLAAYIKYFKYKSSTSYELPVGNSVVYLLHTTGRQMPIEFKVGHNSPIPSTYWREFEGLISKGMLLKTDSFELVKFKVKEVVWIDRNYYRLKLGGLSEEIEIKRHSMSRNKLSRSWLVHE